MAITAILTDWVTIQGTSASSITGATQPEHDYLNVSGAQDIVIYTLVNQVTGTILYQFESAPVKEESLFMPLSGSVTASMSTSPAVTVVRYTSGSAANPPLAAWLRWKLLGGSGAWSITMRVVVAINPSFNAGPMSYGMIGGQVPR